MIADAQLARTTASGAQLALMNPGGIRADFDAEASAGGEATGQITYGEAFTVQPFNNLVVTQTLTGAQLKDVLEQQFVGYQGQTTQKILQVSAGLTYTWSASAALGSKVTDLALNGTADRPRRHLPGHHQRLPGQRRRRLHQPDGRHRPHHRARLRRRRPGGLPGRRRARRSGPRQPDHHGLLTFRRPAGSFRRARPVTLAASRTPLFPYA